MSLSPAVLAALLEAGCTAEQIVAAVNADGAEQEQRATAKRAKDADRQRRHRASRDVTVTECDSVTDPSLSPFPPQTPPNPHTHPDITTRVREDFPKPDWCEAQVWRDLKANRKAKRLPCTPTAHAKLLRDIDKLVDDDWPPGRLIEAIVARGWAAAYDPRDERKPHNDNRKQTGGSTRNAAQAALERLQLGG